MPGKERVHPKTSSYLHGSQGGWRVLSCTLSMYFCKVPPSHLCAGFSHIPESFTCFSLKGSSSLSVVGFTIRTVLQLAGMATSTTAAAQHIVNAVSSDYTAPFFFLRSQFTICGLGFGGSTFMHKPTIWAFYPGHGRYNLDVSSS